MEAGVIWLPRSLVLVVLAIGVWRVYGIRASVAENDSDPVVEANLRRALDSIPLELDDGRYLGTVYEVDREVIDQAGADTFASVLYRDVEGRTYRVYIGGSIRNQENFHAPSYCMPAQGWESLDERTVPCEALERPGHQPSMRRLLLQLGERRMLVYYWFQAGDRLADHEWIVRYYRFLDLLSGAPFRPTLIVTLYVPVIGSEDATEDAATEFLEAFGPHLRSAFLVGG